MATIIKTPKNKAQTLVVMDTRTRTISTYPYDINKWPEPELYKYKGRYVIHADTEWMIVVNVRIVINQ